MVAFLVLYGYTERMCPINFRVIFSGGGKNGSTGQLLPLHKEGKGALKECGLLPNENVCLVHPCHDFYELIDDKPRVYVKVKNLDMTDDHTL